MTGHFDAESNTWSPPGGDWIFGNIHPEDDGCRQKGCMIHNPSTQWIGNREGWAYFPRADGRIERFCPHGIGHPDPDATRWLNETRPDLAADVHGCDGCCRTPNDINPHFEKENR